MFIDPQSPTSSSSYLSTSTIIRLANTNNILSVTSLLDLIFDFLHDPICPPFLMLIPKGESLWKNVFIDVEGVDGFCGYKFENGCSVLTQAMVVQDKSNISKQGSFEWCRDKSLHARLLVFSQSDWLASITSFEGGKKSLKCSKCDVFVQDVKWFRKNIVYESSNILINDISYLIVST